MAQSPDMENIRQDEVELPAEGGRLSGAGGQRLTSPPELRRALDESEERFRRLTEHAKAGICIIRETLLTYASDRLATIFGYRSEEMLGRSFLEFIHTDGLPIARESYQKFNSGQETEQWFETVGLHRDGQRIDIEVSLAMIHDRNRRAGLVLLYDITEKKRTEAHIHLLNQQLIRAQEGERARISRDLHDKVAQDLSSLKIAVDTLFDGVPGVPESAGGRAAEISSRLQALIGSVRDLAYDLRPPGLDKLGLVRTIFLFCEDFQAKTGIRVDLTAAGMEDLALDYDTKINLYRIVQEALRNIQRHASATHAVIRLVAASPHVVLRITDNGRGFDVGDRLAAAHRERRMGLRSMEERARLINGTMNIQSRPMQGTRILVEVTYRSSGRASENTNPHH